MRNDKSRKDDFKDETDPNGAVPPATGRWAEPFRVRSTGLWTVRLRHPETIPTGDGRLVDTLTAADLHTLGDLMVQQNELAREVHR